MIYWHSYISELLFVQLYHITVHCCKKKAVDNICYMLIIRVLSSLSPSRFPHYHLFHRPHPLATGTRVAGTAVPNGPGAAFQPPGDWEEEVLGAWIHVAWLWPYCQYVNLGHRYFILLCNRWKCGKGEGCPITAGSVIDSELILQVSNHWWKLLCKASGRHSYGSSRCIGWLH